MGAILERNVNIKIFDDGGSTFRVLASLIDVEHSFHAEMLVDVASGKIQEVTADMARRPYPTLCPRALDHVSRLRGEVIGRGINRRIVELVGKDTGCAHLVEVFQSAVRFAAMYLINKRTGLDPLGERTLSEQEHRDKWMPVLKNTCQVFREEKSER